VGVVGAVEVRDGGSATSCVLRDTAHEIRDNGDSGSVVTARSITTSIAYILYMHLLYILAGVFITAIVISVILGNMHGTFM
jgi:hypothetical protein